MATDAASGTTAANGTNAGGAVGATSPADAALLRRTRLRLMAWSGGLTIVVLVVLGTAVYLAVAGALASNNTDLLARRAVQIGRFIQERGLPPEGRGLGITFGGEATG